LAAQIDIIYSSDCMMRDTSYTSERIFNFPPPPPGIRTKQAGDGGRQGIIAHLAQIRSLASNLMECRGCICLSSLYSPNAAPRGASLMQPTIASPVCHYAVDIASLFWSCNDEG